MYLYDSLNCMYLYDTLNCMYFYNTLNCVCLSSTCCQEWVPGHMRMLPEIVNRLCVFNSSLHPREQHLSCFISYLSKCDKMEMNYIF